MRLFKPRFSYKKKNVTKCYHWFELDKFWEDFFKGYEEYVNKKLGVKNE